VAVRGGGHNIAGNAVCDGGLTSDLSLMKAVHVDLEQRVSRVEPGVTLGELDDAAQQAGLATPLGINSTGVAGLTLGGGLGWLSRRWGLTIDNLLEAEVDTASGEIVRVNERAHIAEGERVTYYPRRPSRLSSRSKPCESPRRLSKIRRATSSSPPTSGSRKA
jgi:FAD/FMN-containing dehydrogenase